MFKNIMIPIAVALPALAGALASCEKGQGAGPQFAAKSPPHDRSLVRLFEIYSPVIDFHCKLPGATFGLKVSRNDEDSFALTAARQGAQGG